MLITQQISKVAGLFVQGHSIATHEKKRIKFHRRIREEPKSYYSNRISHSYGDSMLFKTGLFILHYYSVELSN